MTAIIHTYTDILLLTFPEPLTHLEADDRRKKWHALLCFYSIDIITLKYQNMRRCAFYSIILVYYILFSRLKNIRYLGIPSLMMMPLPFAQWKSHMNTSEHNLIIRWQCVVQNVHWNKNNGSAADTFVETNIHRISLTANFFGAATESD